MFTITHLQWMLYDFDGRPWKVTESTDNLKHTSVQQSENAAYITNSTNILGAGAHKQ